MRGKRKREAQADTDAAGALAGFANVDFEASGEVVIRRHGIRVGKFEYGPGTDGLKMELMLGIARSVYASNEDDARLRMAHAVAAFFGDPIPWDILETELREHLAAKGEMLVSIDTEVLGEL